MLEYYDQPPSIPLAYRAANGRRLPVMHTPDYFVLRDGSAGWVECKTEEDLEALAGACIRPLTELLSVFQMDFAASGSL